MKISDYPQPDQLRAMLAQRQREGARYAHSCDRWTVATWHVSPSGQPTMAHLTHFDYASQRWVWGGWVNGSAASIGPDWVELATLLA